jgi:S1-C subfamily serine protease
MRIAQSARQGLIIAALLMGAAFLVACERTADLIPGSATPTPSVTATEPASSATPIVVNPPGTDGSGSPTGGRVIPDHDLALSVVQIVAVDTTGGGERAVRYGSGVIVDAEQHLIATAYPVVAPYNAGGTAAYSAITISVDRVPGTEPQREFLAEIAAADPDTGVAVLRVIANADGTPLGGDGFDLPEVALGDAATAGAGFALRLFGYPGVGGAQSGTQVVNTAQASITGQRGSTAVTGRTWFKIDTLMPFGAAGGPAFDRFGALVGILAQDAYTTIGSVGQVRPIDRLVPVLEAARDGEAYQPVLHRIGMIPGAMQIEPATGIHVGRPAFAENAVESAGSRDLFDYETRFAAGLGALYYEYEVNGVTDGATVEERWFLDGILQESLQSSFVWNDGGFGLVTDRITAPSAAGIPSGRWRLDILIGGVRYSTSTAIIGVPLAEPDASFIFAASAATGEGNIAAGAFTGAPQLLMMFDLTGMEAVRRLEWVVFRDNQRVHTSPSIRWVYGDSGRFWVGYRPDAAIGPGTWDVELHADGRIIGVGSITLF